MGDGEVDESGVASFLWFAMSRLTVIALVLAGAFIVLRVFGVVISWAFWL